MTSALIAFAYMGRAKKSSSNQRMLVMAAVAYQGSRVPECIPLGRTRLAHNVKCV